jgi:N-hydroxyarylamine O-acetyltransferase
MQSRVQDTWRTLYRFDLVRAFPVDYEVSNYFLSTHPSSHFRLGLFVARTLRGRRIALSDRRLSEHTLGAATEQRTLDSPAEIRHTLEHTFGIRVPATQQLQQAFEGLFHKGV